MHAWLIATTISKVMSPSLLLCSPARVLQFSQTQTFPCHTRKLPEKHTHHFMTLWPDQAPTHSLSLKPRPLWILTVLHFKLNITLVSLQHGCFYTVTNCHVSANVSDINTKLGMHVENTTTCPQCKGNFLSSKMIDIKQIALIANAKTMLYTFFIQKVIL